ncbi:MAG: patatin-like phospholipase family protein [Magnetococcales bacterium]|nr:patatin-like phospholipase family protein [Magnetococcales bacterium]
MKSITEDLAVTPPLRILSIDGGGLKGAMPAAFLATIEEQTKQRIVDHFDLIVGTSTGGIIALGLGLGISAEDILKFYQEKGPGIFGQHSNLPWYSVTFSRWFRTARQFFKSKHKPACLRAALEEVFQDRLLGESQTRLVIPAWHSVRRTPYLFKTAHHPRLEIDFKEKVVDVALATAAAPTYLPAHQIEGGVMLTDGGVWANNPTGVAAVEAVGVLNWEMSNVRILSLGCTDEYFVVDPDAGFSSMGIKGGIELMFQGQSFGALSTAKLLLGGGAEALERIHRVDVTVPKGFASMDDTGRIHEMAGLGRSEARERLPQIRKEFITVNRQPFQPFHWLEMENSQ